MNVSIIIISYNTKQLIYNCIQSIIKFTSEIEYEIIVIDNASIDGSQKMIKCNFPFVKLVELEENLGFGKANNLGAMYSSGEYLFFLNSDTLLINNSVKALFDYISNKADVGCVGCLLLDSEMKFIHSYSRFPTMTSYIILELSKLKKYFFCKKTNLFKSSSIKYKESPFEVEYITGADIMIPRIKWNLLNGFDPDFFMYFEEAELQLRMSKLNFKRIVLPSCKIIHLVGGSSSVGHKKRMMISKSMLCYFKKHRPSLQFFLFKKILYFLYILNMDSKYSKQERKEFLRLF